LQEIFWGSGEWLAKGGLHRADTTRERIRNTKSDLFGTAEAVP